MRSRPLSRSLTRTLSLQEAEARQELCSHSGTGFYDGMRLCPAITTGPGSARPDVLTRVPVMYGPRWVRRDQERQVVHPRRCVSKALVSHLSKQRNSCMRTDSV